MAGSDSRFDATEFRDAIHFAMTMGFPEDTQEQITWQWRTEREFVREDSGGEPFEWSASQVVSENEISDMIVRCALKFETGSGGQRVGGTVLGVMDTSNATVTLLDEEYDALLEHGDGNFPDQAVIDNAVYQVQFIKPPTGLFEVTVYEVLIQAIDEG